MNPLHEACGLSHDPGVSCIAALQQVTAVVMLRVGTPARCRGCGADILFVKHVQTGKLVPYDRNGVNHFATCPDAARFKVKK